MRYKVGDRVVNLINDFNIPVGTVSVITKVDDDNEGYYTNTTLSLTFEPLWFQEEILLEEVWNSPLYKSMREYDET